MLKFHESVDWNTVDYVLFESTLKEWIKENFEMDGDLVHSEVSKMIISEELKASWDEPTNSLGKWKFTYCKDQYGTVYQTFFMCYF